jgi:hypothetical protein
MAAIEGSTASELLRATDSVRRRTRVVRRSFWLPLALFGAVVIASGATCAGAALDVGGTWENRGYWLLAGGAAYAIVYWYYRRRPVWSEIRPYVVLGAFLLWMSIGFYMPVFSGRLAEALNGEPLAVHLLQAAAAALVGVAALAWLHRRRWILAIAGLLALGLLVVLDSPSVLLTRTWGGFTTALAGAVVAADAARLGRKGIAWTAGLVGATAVIIGVFPQLFGPYYQNYPAALVFGYQLVPSAAPVAAVAVGLLVLAVQVRSPWLSITAVTVGVLAVLSGLYIIDNFFNTLPHCSADMAGIGGVMLICAGIAAVADRRRLASP